MSDPAFELGRLAGHAAYLFTHEPALALLAALAAGAAATAAVMVRHPLARALLVSWVLAFSAPFALALVLAPDAPAAAIAADPAAGPQRHYDRRVRP